MSGLDGQATAPDFVRTERQPQGTCAKTVWDGLPGTAGFHPHCYWAVARPKHYHCPTQGCFWRKFHQMGRPAQQSKAPEVQPAEAVSGPRQRGLDL